MTKSSLANVTPSESLRVVDERWSALRVADKRAIHAIYEQTFPPKERRDWECVISTGCRLWTARYSHVIVGFATAVPLGDTRIALLQYLAVSPAVQSRGIGSALLAGLSGQLAAEQRIKGLLLEIEDPLDINASARSKDRLTFYERWGAEQVNCVRGYFMTDFSNPTCKIPMLLLWKPLVRVEQP